MANDQRNPIFSESSVIRGVHGGLSPDALPAGYLAQGANISIRGGFVSTRPRFRSLGSVPLDDPSLFRGAGVYSLRPGDGIVFGIGREVYSFDPSTGNSTLVYTFPSESTDHYFTQADRFLVGQNGMDLPFFHERGEFTREAEPEGELPTGYMMAYAHGRIFMVPKKVGEEEGRPYWIAGDILLPLDPQNVFNLTENTYWNEGGATGLPFESGFITGLSVFHNAQTGSGLGALLAFGRSGVSAYQVAASRADWKDLDFSQVLYTGEGTLSHRSIVPVNSDIFYRATDGLRSIQLSMAGNGGWTVAPVSYEVGHRLDLDQKSDLKDVASSFAQNRLLTTTAGRTSNGWNGLLSLDTFVASTLSSSSAPAYDDLWVSRPVLTTVRCRLEDDPSHVVLMHRNGKLHFCCLTTEDQDDFGDRPVTSRMYTRAYSTKSMDLISLQYLDVIFRNIDGPLAARAYFRSDGYPRWTPFSGVLEVENQMRRGVRFSARGVNGCPEDGSPPHVGSVIQICIEWTGVADVELWSLSVNPEQADPGMLSACSTYTSSLSEELDLAMVELDDVNDLIEVL